MSLYPKLMNNFQQLFQIAKKLVLLSKIPPLRYQPFDPNFCCWNWKMRRRYLHGDPTRPYKACAQQQVLKTSCSLLICGLKFNWSVYKPAQCLTNLCLFKAIKILHKHWNHELCIQFLNHKFIVCKFYVRINTESNWVKVSETP